MPESIAPEETLINVKLRCRIKGWIFLSAQEGGDCFSKGKRIHSTFFFLAGSRGDDYMDFVVKVCGW